MAEGERDWLEIMQFSLVTRHRLPASTVDAEALEKRSGVSARALMMLAAASLCAGRKRPDFLELVDRDA